MKKIFSGSNLRIPRPTYHHHNKCQTSPWACAEAVLPTRTMYVSHHEDSCTGKDLQMRIQSSTVGNNQKAAGTALRAIRG